MAASRKSKKNADRNLDPAVNKRIHPKTFVWDEKGGEEIMVLCPRCGKIEELDGFDVMGADEDCVFCTDCHQEIDLS